MVFLSTTAFSQVKPVQDSYNLLTTKQNKELTDMLLKHQTKIVIILKDSDNIEQDALTFGRENGPDIVIWYNKKTVRVETGTKLEGDLPDLASSTIVRKHLQLLKDKKYFDFFNEVSNDIYKKVEATDSKKKSDEGDLIQWLLDNPLVLVVVIILWLILLVICPDCALFFLYILLSSKSSGRGSGDFSGGGSSSKL